MVAICINLLLIPAIIIALCYFLRHLAVKVIPLWLLRFWIYPGTAVHELSHAAACLPMMASVQSVTLFRLDGSGEVKHGPSKFGKLGDMVIALAPLVGGLLVLWLINVLLDYPFRYQGAIAGNGAESGMFTLAMFQLGFEDLVSTVTGADWLDWRPWLMLYLVFSISLNLAPSPEDMKNAAVGILIVMAVVIAWLWIEHFAIGSNAGMAALVTRFLGMSHILLLYLFLSFGLLGLLALLGKLTTRKGS